MLKKHIFFTLFLLLPYTQSPASPNTEEVNLNDFNRKNAIQKQYYSQCLSRYKNKKYLKLRSKCKCDAIQFDKLGYAAARDTSCDLYNLRKGEQIVEQTSSCKTLSPISELKIDMNIVEYREFTKTGWRNGVMKRKAGLIWKIVSLDDNDGVEVKLIKGRYYDYKAGDISPYKRKNSYYYKKAYPNAEPNEQILKAYKHCIEPKL